MCGGAKGVEREVPQIRRDVWVTGEGDLVVRPAAMSSGNAARTFAPPGHAGDGLKLSTSVESRFLVDDCFREQRGGRARDLSDYGRLRGGYGGGGVIFLRMS